ncbi:MAG: NifB/NifX family molybdenum-iron cluster-binding protein [bacterium]|nr:NifB/NifX family molybdenum-iron cluster-binding protein [bacterium]
MRIAIPTDDNTHIAGHTGRAGAVAIFKIQNGAVTQLEIRENTFTGHHQHGHEHGHGGHDDCDHGQHGHGGGQSHGALIEALRDCQVMIARGMGPRLVNDLESCGIQVVFTAETELQRAAEKFAQGQLPNQPDQSTCHRT